MSTISQAEKEIILKKHARALELRAEYIKQISNPYRHATGEGGTLVSRRFQNETTLILTSTIRYVITLI